jgi:hypothetical protein
MVGGLLILRSGVQTEDSSPRDAEQCSDRKAFEPRNAGSKGLDLANRGEIEGRNVTATFQRIVTAHSCPSIGAYSILGRYLSSLFDNSCMNSIVSMPFHRFHGLIMPLVYSSARDFIDLHTLSYAFISLTSL